MHHYCLVNLRNETVAALSEFKSVECRWVTIKPADETASLSTNQGTTELGTTTNLYMDSQAFLHLQNTNLQNTKPSKGLDTDTNR